MGKHIVLKKVKQKLKIIIYPFMAGLWFYAVAVDALSVGRCCWLGSYELRYSGLCCVVGLFAFENFG